MNINFNKKISVSLCLNGSKMRLAGVRLAIIFIALIFSAACIREELREPQSLIEVRNKNMVRQTHEFTCGAAALATVMTELGTPTSELEVLTPILEDSPSLRLEDKSDSEEVEISAANLEKIARKAGFKAITLKINEDTFAVVALDRLSPAICRIKLFDEYLHFVVIEGIEDGWLLMSDPAYGRIRLPVSQFGKVWEEGDRVMLVISKMPFQAWKSDSGQVFFKRDSKEIITKENEIAPYSLYNTALRTISLTNNFQLRGFND